MNDDEWFKTVVGLLGEDYFSTTWATSELCEDLAAINMYSYNKQRDTRDGDVAQAALEALEAGISLEELLKSNKTVKIWYGQMTADRDKAKIARQREAERQRKLAEKKRQEDELRAMVAEKLTPEELAAFGLTKKGVKK